MSIACHLIGTGGTGGDGKTTKFVSFIWRGGGGKRYQSDFLSRFCVVSSGASNESDHRVPR